MGLIDILLIVAGVGYVLVSRVMGDIVQIKRLLVLPVVLTGVGVTQFHGSGRHDAATIAFIAAGVVLSVAIGAVRGLTVHLGARNGELWMRYGAATIGLWVLSFAAKAALVPVEVAVTGDPASTATQGLLFSVGLGVLAESAVVLLRAVRRDGAVVWAKGSDGAPHTASPAFDRLRDHVRAGGSVPVRHVVSTVKRDR